MRLLGSHGSPTKYVHQIVGVNSRLDTVQAVVLRAKLARLAKWNELRREAAARYAELLADLPGVRVPVSAAGNEDVWHLYVVRTSERDRVLGRLNEAGVGAGIHYPQPIHLTPAYAHLGSRLARSRSRRGSVEILSLPLYPHLTFEQQEFVVAAVQAALGATRDERAGR